MFVKRRGSAKRRRRLYEVLYLCYSPGPSAAKEISSFLGNLGKVECVEEYYIWIETGDGRKIGPGQFLLKDDRRKRILSFDFTTFYDWFDIWRNT